MLPVEQHVNTRLNLLVFKIMAVFFEILPFYSPLNIIKKRQPRRIASP